MKTGFAPLILVIIIGIVLAAGGLGLGLAWKAGLLGKPGGPQDGTTTNGTQPPPSNGTENGEVPPSPSPDIPEDWKTYTNPTYGFSTKYPQDWWTREIVEEIQYTYNRTLIFVGFYLPGHGEDTAANVEVVEKDLVQVVEKTKTAVAQDENSIILSESPITVSGVLGVELVIRNLYAYGLDPGTSDSAAWYLEKNGLTYVIVGPDLFRAAFEFLD